MSLDNIMISAIEEEKTFIFIKLFWVWNCNMFVQTFILFQVLAQEEFVLPIFFACLIY